MSVSASQVTVGTSPTQLSVAPADRLVGSSVAVNNTSANTVYLGGANVTTSTGYPLAAGQQIGVDLVTVSGTFPTIDEVLYGVAASSSVVAVLATGV